METHSVVVLVLSAFVVLRPITHQPIDDTRTNLRSPLTRISS